MLDIFVLATGITGTPIKSLLDQAELNTEGEAMTLETLVLWIVIGGIAGVLADALVPRIHLGLAEAIIVGILGAFIGGWLFGQLGVAMGGGLLGSIVVAFVGAVVLLLILSAVRRR